MDMTDERKQLTRGRVHSVFIENHERAVITGVADVISFNEEEVSLVTDFGTLEVFGEGLHMNKLNLEDGQVIVEGNVMGAEYTDAPSHGNGKGLLSKMFR